VSRVCFGGFLLALFVFLASALSPGKTEASAGASLLYPRWSCSNGYASVVFGWTPSAGVVQWLDISLSNNGFAPGTFLGAGPMSLGQNTLTWNGIKPGFVHYWRVNTLTSAGWVPSATGQFVPCGDSAPPRPPAAPVGLTGLAGQLLDAHNVNRAAAGLAPLFVDPTLTAVASERANDMASRNYFSHTSPSGVTAFGIMDRYGMGNVLAAENIARNNYPDSQSAGTAFTGFMNSPGHRRNILDPALTRVGIAVAYSGEMKYYAVVFAGR
jgi:uncharacterized protein YkwD